jgi:hypothetical protein
VLLITQRRSLTTAVLKSFGSTISTPRTKYYVRLKGKYEEEFMAQYKIKDAGILDGIVKFIIYTKIQTSWTILELEDQDGRLI